MFQLRCLLTGYIKPSVEFQHLGVNEFVGTIVTSAASKFWTGSAVYIFRAFLFSKFPQLTVARRHLNQSHASYSVVRRELCTIQYFHGKI